jgi:hypothetical protein
MLQAISRYYCYLSTLHDVYSPKFCAHLGFCACVLYSQPTFKYVQIGSLLFIPQFSLVTGFSPMRIPAILTKCRRVLMDTHTRYRSYQWRHNCFAVFFAVLTVPSSRPGSPPSKPSYTHHSLYLYLKQRHKITYQSLKSETWSTHGNEV